LRGEQYARVPFGEDRGDAFCKLVRRRNETRKLGRKRFPRRLASGRDQRRFIVRRLQPFVEPIEQPRIVAAFEQMAVNQFVEPVAQRRVKRVKPDPDCG